MIAGHELLLGLEDRLAQVALVGGDAATVGLDHASPDFSIAGTLGTYDWGIGGMRSTDYLWYRLIYGYGLYQQGVTTGRNRGLIKGISDTDVKLDVNTDNGDSGGPYFDVEDDLAYVAAIHVDEEDYAIGKTIEWAEDSLNLTF